jgi:DNA repair exonuclease SbcCD nuclease subunit
MKLVFFSDLHAHPFAEFGAESRLQDCLSVFDDVFAYCVKHGIEHVFFGGDLFHVRGVINTAPYVAVAHKLKQFKDAGITFYAADGNHDHEDKDGRTHALQPLIAGKLVVGIGRKGFRIVDLGDVVVTMFAFCESKDVLAKRIGASQQLSGAPHIALFHHGFKGAKVGSALEYEVKEPIDAKELKLDKLYDLVLSGHYHTHQAIVGIKRGWYIGSPLEHTRSDRTPEQKGFLVVDTRTMKFKRVPIDRPRFVTVHADEGDVLQDIKGNFVDVVYSTTEGLDALLDEVRKLGARGVNPIALPQAKTNAKKRLNVSPALAPSKVLTRYVKHKKKDLAKAGLNRGAMVRLGMDLIRETEK